jgi:ATP-dependent helicase Lhr and Lhr-like helicase
VAAADLLLREVSRSGRLLDGEFRPGGRGREWCDPDVLQTIRRRSLARLRREVEPVDPQVLGRLVTTWQGIVRPRSGLDALLDAIDGLQGAPLPASIFETEILSARVAGYDPADLDALAAAGEIVWCGVGPLGERDGRLAIYLTDHLPVLRRSPEPPALGAREQAIVAHLTARGASFFADLHAAAGGGYPGESVDALWNLVWAGVATNDTFHALRAFTEPPDRRRRREAARVRVAGPASRSGGRAFRSRRAAPRSAEGRWSLVGSRATGIVSPTEWSAATARQLLSRYGIITRDVAAADAIPGGFSAVYDVLRAMEDAGRIRRGYFVAGVGATQFAQPAALDLLRSLRDLPEEPEIVRIAATDPANPYGTLLPWPGDPTRREAKPEAGVAPREPATPGRRLARTVGATVILVNGALSAYLRRGARQVQVFLPEDEPARSTTGRAVAGELAAIARTTGLLVAEINGVAAAAHPLGAFLAGAGFTPSALGYVMRREAGSRTRTPPYGAA